MQKLVQNKKGNLALIVPSVLTLILAAAILVFGLIITEKLKDTTGTYASTVVNETLTTVTETGEFVSRNNSCAFQGFAISIATNATGGQVIAAGNFTVNADTGKVTSTGSSYNNTNWNVTYSYSAGQSACEAATNTVTGLGTFADFWEIIVLAIVITVVISLLLVVFAGGARKAR